MATTHETRMRWTANPVRWIWRTAPTQLQGLL